MDYYDILEIRRDANDEKIKRAYRKLSLKYHPKRNEEKDTSKHFSALCEAYDVLSSEKWKILYDQFGADGIKTGVPVPPDGKQPEGNIEVYTFHGNPSKVFRAFFGVDNPFADFCLPNLDPSFKFFDVPAKADRGPDQEHELKLTLDDAYHGCIKSVSIPIREVDESGKTNLVQKSFTFRVPKGTRNGHLFHFADAGNSGPNILPGNITFKAEIEPNPEFRLEGSNLIVSQKLLLVQALTGCTIDVATFDGRTVHIPITDVIRPGHRIVLKGEGMPIIGFASKGDLLIEFDVIFPEKLNKNQKESIKQALIKRNE